MPRNIVPAALLKRRRYARLLRWLGLSVGVFGGAAALIGAVLPWAMVTAFGVPLSLPGVLTWGAVSGLFALIGLLTLRSAPLVACLAGAFCVVLSFSLRDTAAREMQARVIRVERAIAPLNERMAQIALSPIEPFSGIGPAARYRGPGPLWCLWGGAGLMAGAGIAFAGENLRRRCVSCGFLASAHRALRYCPNCGAQCIALPLCPHCHAPLDKRDRFCGACGGATQ